MNADEIRYVRASDGCHLAYRVTGDGPIDLIEIGGYGTLFPLDAVDDQPRWRRFEERLSRFCRLIRFDLRGIGLSDPITDRPDIDRWVDDAVAVLDAVGSTEAATMGASFGGLAATQLAASHPDRVSSVILANTSARFLADVDYRIGAPKEMFAEMASVADPERSDDDGPTEIEVMAPSLADDADVRRWWERSARRGAGPAMAAQMWEVSFAADVRAAAKALQQPALIIHAVDNAFIPATMGHWLADHIAGAERFDLPGADQVIWAAPNDVVSERIEEFLTGERSPQTGTRRLHAILFTDIVDSTATNATAGDHAWVELLERHDEEARRLILRRGGRLVKSLGDGLLAVFALASDAVDTATDIETACAEMGLSVRAGVHVAEVDDIGDDVLGMGVTIAARAMDTAAGGEVVVTRAIKELLTGSTHDFDDRDPVALKGVPGEWVLSVAR